MNDHELLEEARDRIFDVMALLACKGAENTELILCSMMVPILHCAHDCAPSASHVRGMINAANKLARELSEGGQD